MSAIAALATLTTAALAVHREQTKRDETEVSFEESAAGLAGQYESIEQAEVEGRLPQESLIAFLRESDVVISNLKSMRGAPTLGDRQRITNPGHLAGVYERAGSVAFRMSAFGQGAFKERALTYAQLGRKSLADQRSAWADLERRSRWPWNLSARQAMKSLQAYGIAPIHSWREAKLVALEAQCGNGSVEVARSMLTEWAENWPELRSSADYDYETDLVLRRFQLEEDVK